MDQFEGQRLHCDFICAETDIIFAGEENLEVTKEVTLNVSKIATVMEESSKTGEQLEMTY